MGFEIYQASLLIPVNVFIFDMSYIYYKLIIKREEIAMFMDVVVFAGIGTVALMVAFFVGLFYFVRKVEQDRKSS